MKISKSKQELARIIRGNGGWTKGNYAVQDKDDKCVWFMTDLEGRPSGNAYWPGCKSDRIKHDSLLPNWHQTILSRDEYFHIYPAPDADGWIEWKGGECPVEKGTLVDVIWRDKTERSGVKALHLGGAGHHFWVADGMVNDIIAYRLHKPEAAQAPQEPKPVTAPEAKPTIEQLAEDYRSAKDYALRLQEEANIAWNTAEKAKGELIDAGKSIGIDIQPITTKQEPEMAITDWRDLQIGDIIECVDGDIKDKIGMTGPVVEFAPDATDGMHVRLGCDNGPNKGRLGWPRKFRFIRRP